MGPPSGKSGTGSGEEPDPLESASAFFLTGAKVSLLLAVAGPVAALLTTPWHQQGELAQRLLLLGLCGLFGSLSALFLIRLAATLQGGEPLGIDSHWGGLGGGLGGWRVSRPLSYLFCALTFGALLAVSAVSFPGAAPKSQPQPEQKKQESGEGKKKQETPPVPKPDPEAGQEGAAPKQ